jgi:hypothetical protein
MLPRTTPAVKITIEIVKLNNEIHFQLQDRGDDLETGDGAGRKIEIEVAAKAARLKVAA